VTLNPWGKRPDPKTGLAPYPVGTNAAIHRLNRQAHEAKERRERVRENLDGIASLFETAFEEADRAAATRARITATAQSIRK
jgi:hypothetical protein